jgi:hypothetical protein
MLCTSLACEAKEESEEEMMLYHATCHVRLHRYLQGLPNTALAFFACTANVITL